MAFAFLGVFLRYTAYVDGFNFYHRRLKGTPYKWLNLVSLFQSFQFQNLVSLQVKYFTAQVINRPNNPSVRQRQEIYLRALQTQPEVEIFYGQFKSRDVKGALLDSKGVPTKNFVTVRKYEEKGSDVNVATQMVADAFRGNFDAAILLSNDSDLAGPLKIVNDELQKPVILISPGNFHMLELKRHSSITKLIDDQQLQASLFPNQMTDTKGKIHKPKDW